MRYQGWLLSLRAFGTFNTFWLQFILYPISARLWDLMVISPHHLPPVVCSQTSCDITFFFFSCDRECSMNGSVRLSVYLSVCLLHLFDNVPVIASLWNFQEWLLLKKVISMQGQVQRSNVKVTEVKSQLSHFRTITPVWIHIWWWNNAHSLMWHRRGVLLFFKVICQISRSHRTINRRFWPEWDVSGL